MQRHLRLPEYEYEYLEARPGLINKRARGGPVPSLIPPIDSPDRPIRSDIAILAGIGAWASDIGVCVGRHCNYIRVINCGDNRFDIRDKNGRLPWRIHLSILDEQ